MEAIEGHNNQEETSRELSTLVDASTLLDARDAIQASIQELVEVTPLFSSQATETERLYKNLPDVKRLKTEKERMAKTTQLLQTLWKSQEKTVQKASYLAENFSKRLDLASNVYAQKGFRFHSCREIEKYKRSRKITRRAGGQPNVNLAPDFTIYISRYEEYGVSLTHRTPQTGEDENRVQMTVRSYLYGSKSSLNGVNQPPPPSQHQRVQSSFSAKHTSNSVSATPPLRAFTSDIRASLAPLPSNRPVSRANSSGVQLHTSISPPQKAHSTPNPPPSQSQSSSPAPVRANTTGPPPPPPPPPPPGGAPIASNLQKSASGDVNVTTGGKSLKAQLQRAATMKAKAERDEDEDKGSVFGSTVSLNAPEAAPPAKQKSVGFGADLMNALKKKKGTESVSTDRLDKAGLGSQSSLNGSSRGIGAIPPPPPPPPGSGGPPVSKKPAKNASGSSLDLSQPAAGGGPPPPPPPPPPPAAMPRQAKSTPQADADPVAPPSGSGPPPPPPPPPGPGEVPVKRIPTAIDTDVASSNKKVPPTPASSGPKSPAVNFQDQLRERLKKRQNTEEGGSAAASRDNVGPGSAAAVSTPPTFPKLRSVVDQVQAAKKNPVQTPVENAGATMDVNVTTSPAETSPGGPPPPPPPPPLSPTENKPGPGHFTSSENNTSPGGAPPPPPPRTVTTPATATPTTPSTPGGKKWADPIPAKASPAKASPVSPAINFQDQLRDRLKKRTEGGTSLGSTNALGGAGSGSQIDTGSTPNLSPAKNRYGSGGGNAGGGFKKPAEEPISFQDQLKNRLRKRSQEQQQGSVPAMANVVQTAIEQQRQDRAASSISENTVPVAVAEESKKPETVQEQTIDEPPVAQQEQLVPEPVPQAEPQTEAQPETAQSQQQATVTPDMFVTALADYAATGEEQMSLKAGEMYIMLVADYVNGWSYGCNLDGTAKGMFPATFVQKTYG